MFEPSDTVVDYIDLMQNDRYRATGVPHTRDRVKRHGVCSVKTARESVEADRTCELSINEVA